MLDELDPRDGPTKEWLAHHESMPREKSPGRVKKDRLYIMALAGDITPAEFDAGDRFAIAYSVGGIGEGASARMFRVSGGGNGNGHDFQIDMAALLRGATEALNAKHGFVGGLSPGQFMVELCVNDCSFKDLGNKTGLHEERARTRAAKMLQTLAVFFEAVDRRNGVSRTPGTVEQIKRRRDPEEAA